MADIRSAAWLEQELYPDLDRHCRHQMADICEPDNIERVWRVLATAVAEIRLDLLKILHPDTDPDTTNDILTPEVWRFEFLFKLHSSTMTFLKEKIHEYLVASVMADRTQVIIPEAAKIWKERVYSIRSELGSVMATVGRAYTPVRRPLWPYA